MKPILPLLTLLAVALIVRPALAETAEEQANIVIVRAFYEAGLNQKDFAAASRYLGDRYTQHNPNAADGPAGFKDFLAYLREKFPQSHSDIKEAFADGDRVILHVHAVRTPGDRGSAIVDIFRLDGGKIVEHWDVVQAIPETAANTNTMF
jgi:predicted SnoaL-like aldol condensation-catalyzing enzyme